MEVITELIKAKADVNEVHATCKMLYKCLQILGSTTEPGTLCVCMHVCKLISPTHPCSVKCLYPGECVARPVCI